MTSLRGKMAWSYLQQSSLWATHARSRYRITGPRSYLWKTISPFISNLALECHWRIGNGKTLLSWFGQCIGIPIPSSLGTKTVKEVLMNQNMHRFLLHNSNPNILQSIPQSFGNVPDKLIWDGDPCGFVTIANFLKKSECLPAFLKPL